ncbi:MAG: hypothetical protein U5K43_08400 [Halofilum sp. (in: g-proteobacteria)]|nr:hypothetical protein [Halofilum sp. (in: g-proteobacteria)]
MPLGRVNWAFPEAVPLHNWAMTALTGCEGSYPGPLMASEALRHGGGRDAGAAGTRGLRARGAGATDEGVELGKPELGAWRTMTEHPESFWDGSWIE